MLEAFMRQPPPDLDSLPAEERAEIWALRAKRAEEGLIRQKEQMEALLNRAVHAETELARMIKGKLRQ